MSLIKPSTSLNSIIVLWFLKLDTSSIVMWFLKLDTVSLIGWIHDSWVAANFQIICVFTLISFPPPPPLTFMSLLSQNLSTLMPSLFLVRNRNRNQGLEFVWICHLYRVFTLFTVTGWHLFFIYRFGFIGSFSSLSPEWWCILIMFVLRSALAHVIHVDQSANFSVLLKHYSGVGMILLLKEIYNLTNFWIYCHFYLSNKVDCTLFMSCRMNLLLIQYNLS